MATRVDEYSTEYLAKYKKAAGSSASAADKAGNFKKANKRFRGIMAATRKQFANETKPKQNEETDMLKIQTLSEEEYDRIRDLYGKHAARSLAYSRWNRSHPDYGKTSTQTRPASTSTTSSSSKMYHKVPFAHKDAAKKEGMRWDPDVKKWYHTSHSASSASKFQKEEVEIVSEGPYSSGQLKPSKEQLKQVQSVPSGGRTSVIRDKDAKGTYTQTMKDGKVVSKVYESGSVKPDPNAGKKWREAARQSKSWSPINLDRYKAAAKAASKNEEVESLHELKKSTLASYTNKVVDPVYGTPRTTKKLTQRLAGLTRAHQRAIGKKPTSEEISVEEQKKVQMHKPGWMLRADPELGAKFAAIEKRKKDMNKNMSKYGGKTSAEIAAMQKK